MKVILLLKEISIEILRKCPNHCIHCSSRSAESCSELLPYSVCSSAIKDAARLGASVISFSGGEPFLHPDIKKMIDLTYSIGLTSYIYTSGVVFNPAGIRVPLKTSVLYALKGKVNKIIFNIGASIPETYDAITSIPGSFELMKQSVTTVVGMGICAEAHFVPMCLNLSQIEQTLQLCQKLGIKKVSFLRLVLQGRAREYAERVELSSEELWKLRHDLEKLRKQFPSTIRIGIPLSINGDSHRCMAAMEKLNIRYDGKVFPCEVFKDGCADLSLTGFEPESIYEQSLLDIYQHSPYLHQVRTMANTLSHCDSHETCIGQYLINSAKRRDMKGAVYHE